MSDPIYYDYNALFKERLHAERLTNTSDEPIPPYYRKLIDVIQYYSSKPGELEGRDPQYRDLVLDSFAYLIEHIDVPFVELFPRFIQLLEPYLFVHDPSEDDFQDLGDLLNYHRRLIRIIPMMGDKELYLKGLFNFILSYSQLLKYDETILHLLIIAFLGQDICSSSIQNFLSTYFPDEYRSFSDPDVFLSRTRDTQHKIISFYLSHIPTFFQLSIEYRKTLMGQYMATFRYGGMYCSFIPSYDEIIDFLELILPLFHYHEEDFDRRLSFVVEKFLPSISSPLYIIIILTWIYKFLVNHKIIWKGKKKYKDLLDSYKTFIINNLDKDHKIRKKYETLFQETHEILNKQNLDKQPQE